MIMSSNEVYRIRYTEEVRAKNEIGFKIETLRKLRSEQRERYD
jgi:hypothetical protein